MLLLDTNVVSELRKIRSGKCDPQVASWAETLDPRELFLSVISVHELEIGVLLGERRDRQQGAVLRTWFEKSVLRSFEGRILPVDTAIARRAAKLHVPDPQSINDAFIAATALVHGMTVATRNVADFFGSGVSLLNPWEWCT